MNTLLTDQALPAHESMPATRSSRISSRNSSNMRSVHIESDSEDTSKKNGKPAKPSGSIKRYCAGADAGPPNTQQSKKSLHSSIKESPQPIGKALAFTEEKASASAKKKSALRGLRRSMHFEFKDDNAAFVPSEEHNSKASVPSIAESGTRQLFLVASYVDIP